MLCFLFICFKFYIRVGKSQVPGGFGVPFELEFIGLIRL